MTKNSDGIYVKASMDVGPENVTTYRWTIEEYGVEVSVVIDPNKFGEINDALEVPQIVAGFLSEEAMKSLNDMTLEQLKKMI